jgi:hypothetical protein
MVWSRPLVSVKGNLNACHALTLESLFMSLFWIGQGVIWVGILCSFFLCFCISLFRPGMVLNQGQLSIVVSDWEPYFGSFSPQGCCG